MSTDPLRVIQRLAQEVSLKANSALSPFPPANEIARLGGLTREWFETNEIETSALEDGEMFGGYILPEKAREAARKRALLDEHVPCWNEPVDRRRPDDRHDWQAHPDSTREQSERGWRRYVCGMCHRSTTEDSTG